MVEGRRTTGMPWRLNVRTCAAMTGAGALPAGHRQRSRPRIAFWQSGRHRTGRRDEKSRIHPAGLGIKECNGFEELLRDSSMTLPLMVPQGMQQLRHGSLNVTPSCVGAT